MDYRKVFCEAVNAILPPTCPICGKPKPFCGKKRLDICPGCREKIGYIKEPVCLKCGKSIQDDDDEFCRDCGRGLHIYDQAAAVYEYSRAVKNSIYRFKYYNKREYASSYAAEMVRSCGGMINVWSPDVIMPVPIHSSRLKERGYNQAGLIAAELGRLMGIPVDETSLKRVVRTTPMKELNNLQRIKNLQNAFQVDRKDVIYKKVLIVDDIYTTGATFDACAAVLKESGTQEVYGVSLCVGDGF